MDHLAKKLFCLVKKQLDDRLKELEQEEKVLPTKTSDDDESPMMNEKTSSRSATVLSSLSLDSTCALPPRNQTQPKQHSPAAADDERKKKKRRYIYAPSTIEILEASSSPMSMFLYSSMDLLPRGCLAEHDGCDNAELVARAMRCQEILKLSQQVKCKRMEGEAADV